MQRFIIRRQRFGSSGRWYLRDRQRPAFLGQYPTFRRAIDSVGAIIEREGNS